MGLCVNYFLSGCGPTTTRICSDCEFGDNCECKFSDFLAGLDKSGKLGVSQPKVTIFLPSIRQEIR